MKLGMRLLIGILLILCVIGAWFLYWNRIERDERVGKAVSPTAADAFNHDRFDQVLWKYVDSQGRVNYAALKRDSQALESYLDLLAVTVPKNLATTQDRLAFWLNAYNALTIEGVLDHYPTKSVRRIKPFGGFFRRIRFQVGGQSYTLSEIEHGIIRTEFYEPRIHFALVCASRGCPILENRAFLPEALEKRLENAARNFINHPEKVRLDRANRVLYLSKIFEWYSEDFEERHENVIDFIADYLPEADAAFIKGEGIQVKYLNYDWTLNDQAQP